ncbi:hypothetical protein [Chryseobacterium wanjuense]
MKEKIQSIIDPRFTYEYKDGKFVFLEFDEEIVSDSLDKIKTFLKNISGCMSC